MNEAREVLRCLARTVSGFTIYASGHPTRESALDELLQAVADLQASVPGATFTFLEDEIVFGVHPLRGMGEWPWAERFSRVGVQRVEFVGPVERDDLMHFVDDLARRLRRGRAESSEARVTRPTGIRYGLVHRDGLDDAGEGGEGLQVAAVDVDLALEAETVRWLESELRGGGLLHLAEAEGVVFALLQAMHGGREMLLPLTRLKEFDQYTTAHSLNVSVLAMALAEELGMGGAQVRSFGVSGLLHDLGKTRIPTEVLNKPGALTDAERTLIHSHTVEGAKLILEHDADLDLAAIVAYEHHRRTDGGGYPSFRIDRRCHDASDLVHVCDVYDALRTHRPYRDAWPHARVMSYIVEGSGSEFDAHVVRAFVEMMDRCTRADTRVDPDPGPDTLAPADDEAEVNSRID